MAQQKQIWLAAGSIPGLIQWIKGSSVAVSCGVGSRLGRIWRCYGCGVDRQLQLLFDPLARGTSICYGCGPKRKKKCVPFGLFCQWKMCCSPLLYVCSKIIKNSKNIRQMSKSPIYIFKNLGQNCFLIHKNTFSMEFYPW